MTSAVCIDTATDQLQAIGRDFHRRGWSLGTSSNYSAVAERDPLHLLITASGKDKGRLTEEDFVVVDGDGQGVNSHQPASSAETMLHVVLAEDRDVGCVLHTHSVWGTLLSEACFDQRQVTIAGYEMLKGLQGIRTHAASVGVRIFENTQEISDLAAEVRQLRSANDPTMRHAFLMRGHGLYTWGDSIDTARRHVEVLEFLFEVVGRQMPVTTNP